MDTSLSTQSLPVTQIRALDARARQIGLSETVLIENASANLFTVIDQLQLGRKAAVVAGRGNNGADVLSCARKLMSRGYAINVVVVSPKPLGKEAKLQTDVLAQIGAEITFITEETFHHLQTIIANSDFVLEGILGVGISGEVDSFLQRVITAINTHAKAVIACDIPSGLAPDSGKILGAAIKAVHTITFLAPKQGFFINNGPQICGTIHVVDIGISRKLLEQ